MKWEWLGNPCSGMERYTIGISMKDRLIRFLKWSEKYTHTDMLYLASGGFWGAAAQVSAVVIALTLSVVIARYVPKDAYGTYKYVLSIVSLLSVFSLNNVGGAVMQSVARGFPGAAEDGFKANLRWSFAVFLGAFAIGAYYLLMGNPVLGIGVLIGGCASPIIASYNLYLPLLNGEKDFMRVAWYGGFVTNFVPAALLVVVALLAPTPILLLAAYFFGNLLAAAYAYWRACRRYHRNDAHDPEMLAYGKHLSVMGVISGIAGNIDQVLLFHFGGAIDLAIYNFATALPDQTKGPVKVLDQMLQARFARREKHDIRHGMVNKMLWIFIASALFVALYQFLAPYIYLLFFPAYLNAVPYSQVYALGLLSLPFGPASSYLKAKKEIASLYATSITLSVFQILFMLVGVIGWGLWGLVVSIVSFRLLSGAFTFYIYHRSSHTSAAT